MMRSRLLPLLALAAAFLLIGIVLGQEWLEGGYAGRSYDSDIDQYFTDPIFYTNPQAGQSWRQIYYPYFGEAFFQDYALPYQYRPGIYTGPFGVFPYNPLPYYSDFRLKSLAGMKWEPFKKNWTQTMNFTRRSSSMRVFQNGMWVIP